MNETSEAIDLYVGYGRKTFPKEDAGPVLDRFGPAEGERLVTRVSALLEELNGIEPDWSRDDLATASRSAAKQLAERHPEVEDAKPALEWIYSWWWK